jgi:hypothetical protein
MQTSLTAISIFLGFILQNTFANGIKYPDETEIGVNLVSTRDFVTKPLPDYVSQLKTAGVRSILVWDNILAPAKDPVLDFIREADRNGIKVILAVPVQWSGTDFRKIPTLPNGQPDPKFKNAAWAYPLSQASPEDFSAHFKPLFEQIEKSKIALAGLIAGNEINWTVSNGDFPLPGNGKVLNLKDLEDTSEGKRIAAGYLKYLEILKALKEFRDQSSVNHFTPIISAGFFDPKPPYFPTQSMREDSVGIEASIRFFKEHGIDNLIDAYGIHTYPWPDWDESQLKKHLRDWSLINCHPQGSDKGKPCWMTEWGFTNTAACPANGLGQVDDEKRARLTQVFRKALQDYELDKRLIGIDNFAWNSGAKTDATPSPFSIFRCGYLTDSGRIAIKRDPQ